MIEFWIIIGIMTLAAIGIALLPLLRNPQETSPNNREVNLQLYQEQLLNIEASYKDEEIGFDEYQQAKKELAQSMSQDVPSDDQHPEQSRHNGNNYKTAFVLLFAIPIVAISLYLHWGYSKKLTQWVVVKKQNKIVKKELTKYGSIDNLITVFHKHVANAPDNPQGWYLLGKLYLSVGKNQKAVDAFTKANKLKPHDVKTLEKYSEALFLANHYSLDKHAKEILASLLKLSPDNVKAINLLAIDSFRHKKYTQAIKYWRRLENVFPTGSKDAKSLQKVITLAQHKLTRPTKPTPQKVTKGDI